MISTSQSQAHSNKQGVVTDKDDLILALSSENESLKTQMASLSEQLKAVTEHAILSDSRLIQFTDQIFVTSSPMNETEASTSKQSLSIPDVKVKPLISAVPSDALELPTTPNMTSHHNNQEMVASLSTLDIIPVSSKTHLTDCAKPSCIENINLIQSLRTTIEVLEAELQSIKNLSRDHCVNPPPDLQEEWTTALPLKRTSKKCNNKQCNVSEIDPCPMVPAAKNVPFKLRNKQLRVGNHRTLHNPERMKANLPFQSLDIFSDSHGRHISNLLRYNLDNSTNIIGFCKPSAKLAQVLPSCPPVPGTCRVIIGGSNDVDALNQNDLYKNLETALNQDYSTSKLLIATLPFRHDLPYNHPVNEEIMFVNAHLVERCTMFPNVEVIDFNLINRSFFTRHGMHLSYRGKKLLARLILQAANRAALKAPVTMGPPVNNSLNNSCSQAHENHADAVKGCQQTFVGEPVCLRREVLSQESEISALITSTTSNKIYDVVPVTDTVFLGTQTPPLGSRMVI